MTGSMRSTAAFVACAALLLCSVGDAAAKTKKKRAAATPTAALPAEMMKLLLFVDAEPDNGPPPLTVQFSGSVYEGDEAAKPAFEWDFGDGSPTSKEQNPSHIYKKAGKYTAVFTVKEAAGRTGKEEIEILVEPE